MKKIINKIIGVLVLACVVGCGQSGKSWQEQILDINGKKQSVFLLESDNYIKNDSLDGYATLVAIEAKKSMYYSIHIPAKNTNFKISPYQLTDKENYILIINDQKYDFSDCSISTNNGCEEINLKYGYMIDLNFPSFISTSSNGIPNLLKEPKINIVFGYKGNNINMNFTAKLKE
jgi:hypothetical protein